MNFEMDSLYKNSDYFLSCDANDQGVVSGILNANKNLEAEKLPFNFYDIDLSDHEYYLLSQLNIVKSVFSSGSVSLFIYIFVFRFAFSILLILSIILFYNFSISIYTHL
jgi:hypothetical protein